MTPPIPLGNRVLVVQLDNDTTKGGLTLPGGRSSVDKYRRGKIVAVGSGRILESGMIVDMAVAVGDVVRYGMHAGVPVRYQGDEFIVIPENELLCKDPEDGPS